jgi:hypothetical protein
LVGEQRTIFVHALDPINQKGCNDVERGRSRLPEKNTAQAGRAPAHADRNSPGGLATLAAMRRDSSQILSVLS